jgi:hypothetical protein
MKTRQELILDFMLALVGNSNVTKDEETYNMKNFVDLIYTYATYLADEYLENL